MAVHHRIDARTNPNALSHKEVTEKARDSILLALNGLILNIEENGSFADGLLNCVHRDQVAYFVQEFGDSLAKRWGMDNWHGFNRKRG